MAYTVLFDIPMWKRSLVVLALVTNAFLGGAGCSAEESDGSAESEDELALRRVTPEEVDAAKASNDSARIAKVVERLASTRVNLFGNTPEYRVEMMKRVYDGMSLEQARDVRAVYIRTYGEDPDVTISSDGVGAPLLRLPRDIEREMMGAVDGAQMAKDAKTLAELAQKPELTAADRKTYFAMLPMQGLWDAPVRAARGDHELDAIERTLFARATGKSEADLDRTLAAIEAKLPQPDLASTKPREKSIAVIVSSHGAQWEELMGWAKPMHAAGYHLRVFTPDGRPAGLQRDSTLVSVKTVPLGFGCPRELDPAGETGKLAAELLGDAVGASSFDASKFGAVYLAGGLGFNEDIAVAMPEGEKTKLTANANILSLMKAAFAEKLPIVAVCHAPTILAAVPIEVEGRTEMLNKGVPTASLPPFEAYVGLTARKEIQFTYDTNTHRVLEEAGGQTNVLADVANMRRVVKGRKLDVDIVTGPGPQTASHLVAPTKEAIERRWR